MDTPNNDTDTDRPATARKSWIMVVALFEVGCLRAYHATEDSASSTDTTMIMTSTDETSSTGNESSCTVECPEPGRCGDGIQTPPEICDDGNDTPKDGCEADCKPTPNWPCGDGQCLAPEDPASCAQDCPAVCDDDRCDAGEDANNCPQDCMAMCGQGTCEPGEDPESCVKDCPAGQCENNACEDDEDPSICLKDCKIDVCGNNLCEESSNEQTFCEVDCPAICGDGMIWAGELCDDGNTDDLDDCSEDCFPPRYVFITASEHNGALGGLMGADKICDDDALTHSLPGKYQAWLSDGTTAAADRFDKSFSGWYRLPGSKARVARGLAGLTTLNLEIAITVGPNGQDQGSEFVWTNTLPDGSAASKEPVAHCEGWTSAAKMATGRAGSSSFGVLDADWTDKLDLPCDLNTRLYCFQTSDSR